MPVLSDLLHSFGESILTTLDAQAKNYAKKGQKKSRKFKVYGVHFLLPPFIFRDRFSCESIITHIARQCKHFLTFHIFIFFGLNKPGKMIVKKQESPTSARDVSTMPPLKGGTAPVSACASLAPSLRSAEIAALPALRAWDIPLLSPLATPCGAFAPMKTNALFFFRKRKAAQKKNLLLYSPYACFRCLQQPVHANSGEGRQSIRHQALYTYSRSTSHSPCGSTIQERLRREKAMRRF